MSNVNQEYPILDGIAPSWADVIVKITPADAPLIQMEDIKSINTGITVEVGEQRGATGGRVKKRTTGQVSYEMSMTLYRSGFQKFLRGLAAAAPPTRGNQVALSLVHFGIQIQHTPPNDTEIYEIRCKGVRYLGRDYNPAEGTDADTVDVKLSVIAIVDMIDGVEAAAL